MKYSSFKIETIELQNFVGFWLNDVRHFKMDVKEIVTLILGRNGCGKSRLMAQLSPLSPAKHEYRDGGFKEVIALADNHTFTLRCDIKGSTIKGTIINQTTGDVICEGANPSVYNRHVFDLFGYEKELHDLFTGKVKLTSMNGPERKKWFSKLSESDLTFALKFFKQACTNDRDVSGAIKSLKYSIGELRPRVLESADELQAAKERVELIQKDITTIDGQLSDLPVDRTISEESLKRAERDLENYCEEVEGLYVWMPESLAGIDREALMTSIARLTERGDGYLTKIQDLQDRLSKAVRINAVDVDEIKANITEREFLLEQAHSQVFRFVGLLDIDKSTVLQAQAAKDTLDVVKNALTKCTVERNPLNITGQIDVLTNKAREYNEEINKLQWTIRDIDTRLKDIASACDVTCDNCDHTFKVGVKANDVESLKSSRGDAIATGLQVKLKLADVDELLVELQETRRVFTSASELIRAGRSNNALVILYDTLFDEGVWSGNGRSFIGVVELFIQELEYARTYHTVNEILIRLRSEYQLATATQAEDVDMLKGMLSSAMAAKDESILERQELTIQLNLLDAANKRIQRAEDLDAKLIEAVERYEYVEATNVANMKADLLTEHKGELWDMLTVARQRMQEMESQKQKLEMQEQQLNDLERRRIATQQVVKGMGPNGGVLAKYLYQCVQRITDLMTDYIDRIWGYDMKVLPCDVSDGEMDYKFPYWIKHEGNMSPDVAEASLGQKDAFNFVFLLAAYRAKGMQKYPLFIDENFSAFDEGHRNDTIGLLKDLVGQGHHSQLFMVSHDPETHFKLVHANVVVLDSEGISIPISYNKHVIIN